MLAVKFYHLRSLIHRPCVSLSKVPALAPTPEQGLHLEKQQILNSKRICVSSAQSTARLLYGLKDQRSLVHDFPWWQMISCLLCASSILLVAKLDVDGAELSDSIDTDTVEEDANICLKVFEALSTNSNAARQARDMMRRLQETRLPIQRTSPTPSLAAQVTGRADDDSQHVKDHLASQSALHVDSDHDLPTDEQPPGMQRDFALLDPSFDTFIPLAYDFYGDNFSTPFSMPSEISEAILWSSQFVDPANQPLQYPSLDQAERF